LRIHFSHLGNPSTVGEKMKLKVLAKYASVTINDREGALLCFFPGQRKRML
jgi:hypothetical protein